MRRRSLMAGTGAIGALSAATVAPGADAALTSMVHSYNTGRAAYLAHDEKPGGDDVNDALFNAYMDVFDKLKEAEPTTLAGLIAKARVAKVEMAVKIDGSEAEPQDCGEEMARSIVNDLLRIGGVL